jgi:hypothetical protein
MPTPIASSNKEIQSTISNEDHGKWFWYPKVVLLADLLDRGDRETDEHYT